MAALWAKQIILGNKLFSNVPRLLKESVHDKLIELGYENLISE